jgi:cathepsin L
LTKAIALVGPISVTIDASLPSFKSYSSGVYFMDSCGAAGFNHGVTVVGYGTDEETGLDYYLVKNSWGSSWGENGYIRMARNKNNNCLIAAAASYPIV